MIQVGNLVGHPHFLFEKAAQHDERFDVLVVRGTFDFAAGGEPIAPSQDQDPIQLADEYVGPVEESPLAAALARDGDTVIFKPSTDVHVVGTARPPGGRSAPQWVASVSVGPVHKRIRLLGPRRFERTFTGWRLTDPEPTDGVPLDYRRAFGGAFTVPGAVLEDGEPVYLTKRDNPAGCGWLPDAKDMKRVSAEARPYVEAQVDALRELPAPQLEDPDAPIRRPTQRAATQGLGPIARWWAPRIDRAGTFDARWEQEPSPGLPDDFDPAFYQSAHPDLIAPSYLQGDETITLDGLLASGPVAMRLPGRKILALSERVSGEVNGGRMQLDTVVIDLDAQRVSLVWRGAFGHGDPAVAIQLLDEEQLRAMRERAAADAPPAGEEPARG